MIRTDIRRAADRPSEIADKIELMGWHKLRPSEKELCREHIKTVLRYLSPEKKKLVAAIHRVTPPRGPRLYVGKAFLMEEHRRKLTLRRQKLGARLTKMTPAQVDRWLNRKSATLLTDPTATSL